MGGTDRAKQGNRAAENLNTLRQSIDKYYGDTNSYPATLQTLVDKRIRQCPSIRSPSATTWQIDPPPDREQSGVYDIHRRRAGQRLRMAARMANG